MVIDLRTLDAAVQAWASTAPSLGPMLPVAPAVSASNDRLWTWEIRHRNQATISGSVVVVDVDGNAAQADRIEISGGTKITSGPLVKDANVATYELWLTLLETTTAQAGLTVTVDVAGPSSRAAGQWDARLIDRDGLPLTGDSAARELSRIVRGSIPAHVLIQQWPAHVQEILQTRLVAADSTVPPLAFRRPFDLYLSPGGIPDPLGLDLLGCLQWRGQILT